MSNIIDMEADFEKKTLKDYIQKLENEITKYRILLKDAGVETDVSDISDEEAICVEQIARLKEKSSEVELEKKEVEKLDILHKNLKLARGENIRAGRTSKYKEMSSADLLKELNE